MKAQELIIGHLLPITVTAAVLWLVYRLLFRNGNRLKFNRFFLMASMLLALAMPLLGLLSGTELPQVVNWKQNLFNGVVLNEVVVTPDGQPVLPEVTVKASGQSRFSVWEVIGGIYIIGVGVMTLLFLFKLGKIIALIIRSPKRKMDGFTAVFTGRESGPFSFMRYAFFPDDNVDPDILRHEMSHIEHHHSWDILFIEVMMIMQWFNPFIYLYKRELQSLHEYQADRDVVATGTDKRNYMMLILQQCTAVDFSGMSNNFSLILTKKRIKMITRNEKAKGLWWRLLATLPVLAILMIVNTKVTAQEMKTDDAVSSENGENAVYDLANAEIMKKDAIKTEKDSVYNIVEQMPEFPGGTNALLKYVANNIHYPEKAKDAGIEGRVFIGFVIRKDGSVSDVKVMKGIGGGCDEEAVRVINSMPKWTPGRQKGEPVNVNYSMPINFKLDPKKNSKGQQTSAVSAQDNDQKYEYLVVNGAGNGKSEVKNAPDENGVYNIVEEMPKFPGGENAMMKFISENVTYPQEARDKNISGRVFVSFVVEKDGSVNEVKVLRSVDKLLDNEAVRVVKAMPKWNPGKQKGKAVRVNYNLPIFFKLSEGKETKGNNLVGTIWEGTGTGTKGNVTYTWHSVMQFTSEKEGFFVEKLVSQKKNGKPVVEFEDVGMDFEYAFDGKKTGAVTPKNGDGTYMDDLPPEGFVLSDDGKTIVFNFYTATEDTGIKYVTYKKR